MMSIRGRGVHDVIVQPRKVERIKGAIAYANDGPPILLKNCDVQSVREWATEEEKYTYGLSLLSLRRLFARTWPGDANALVYTEGKEFETVGDPQFMPRSRRTSHVVVTIKWLGDKPPPTIPPPPSPTH